MEKFKILCIDDEKEILDLYEEILSDKYDILKADNCTDAIITLKKYQNHIIYVFSDFKMPEKNGFELRKEMIDLGIEIPFAIITGNYTIEMATKAMELRISSFINKPILDEELFKLISDLGEKRKSQLSDEKEMVCSFIAESSPMLEEIETLILALEENPGDINTLNTYFRLLHTIKGTASCVGLKNLPKFTHKYEDLVSRAKENKIKITPNFVDALLYGLDRMKFMYDKITNENIFEFDVDEWIENLDKYLAKPTEDNITNKANEPEIVTNDLKKNQSEKLAIPLDTLDSFQELSGQLTILRNTIYKSIAKSEMKYPHDKDIETLSSSIEELHKITSAVQFQISEMRKINAENITRPLKRVVRDTSKEIGKKVEFHITNEHIKIDNTIAKVISNCLVHIIRNSIDHGIENPETRINSNKDEKGNIYLDFSEEGDTNIVSIQDDGAGLNVKRIKEKALEKNLITSEQYKQMSDEEAHHLIFESGFSTSQTVTNISGRGVGMDMVKSSVLSIGGRIDITSKSGQGTKFVLVLPQPKNVLINKTLLIEDDNECFSIPIETIVEVVKVTPQNSDVKLHSILNHPVLTRFDELIPIFKLTNQLKRNPQEKTSTNSLPEEFEAIIVSHNKKKIAFCVDKVFSIEESVIRKIKTITSASTIYTGVTYYGDDELALVLNIENIIKENIQTINNIKNMTEQTNKIASKKTKKINEFLTFKLNDQYMGIKKDSVQRIEFIEKAKIKDFYGNLYMDYRHQVLKIISFKSSKFLSTYNDSELVKMLILSDNEHSYGFIIDEIYEFIASDYEIETFYSKDEYFIGKIIHNDEILSILNDQSLSKMLEQKLSPMISDELIQTELTSSINTTKEAA